MAIVFFYPSFKIIGSKFQQLNNTFFYSGWYINHEKENTELEVYSNSGYSKQKLVFLTRHPKHLLSRPDPVRVAGLKESMKFVFNSTENSHDSQWTIETKIERATSIIQEIARSGGTRRYKYRHTKAVR